MSPSGERAKLLEPQTGFTNDLPAKRRKQGPIRYWQEAVKAINEAVA